MPNRSVVVDTNTRQLCSYHPDRLTLEFYNNGAATVFFSQDPQNVAAQGLPLAPGASVSMASIEGDEPYMAYHAVAASGSNDVRVYEGYGPLKVKEA